jgi:hypothetical protein
MTDAVRNKSRQVVLGTSFTDWMRQMGFRTISYGPRGSATLIRQQLDRLLACEWMIRWENDCASGEKEFGIKEIKLTNEYVGVDRKNGSFLREIKLTEGFYEHLRKHAVPLNEHAIRQLRDSATALDLYTWLAYRLPRINSKRPATLSWQQLAVHFGNDGNNIRKFRQTVRDAWDRQVSGVYPEARADFDTTIIRLHASPAPLQKKLISGAHLILVADDKSTLADSPDDGGCAATSARPCADMHSRFMAAIATVLGPVEARVWFGDVHLTQVDEVWTLIVPTSLKSEWIRSKLDQAVARAAQIAGLPGPPETCVRKP